MVGRGFENDKCLLTQQNFKNIFSNTLDSLVRNQSANRKLHKNSEVHDRSSQSTQTVC